MARREPVVLQAGAGAGPVGSIAFFVVCGLSGAALSLIGINIDSIVRQLERGGGGDLTTFILTNGLASIFRDAGTIAALSLVAYLLAPKAPEPPKS